MDGRTLSLIAVWMAGAAGCSLVDPNVGPSQTSCAAQAGAASNGNGGGGYYGTGADASGWCGADAGNPCDDCESKWCCQTRLACYADPVCDCADEAIGACANTMPDAAAISTGGAPTQCWTAFSASGHIAQERFECLRAWCQKVCGLPP
jgi:hypothetical protein